MDCVLGAIAVDANGHISAGCSSGGIMLKHAGRIGQAAVFGAGCWAEEKEDFAVAASLSGCGESIIRTQLARVCCEHLLESRDEEDMETSAETLRTVFLENFVQNDRLLRFQRNQHKVAGVLLVKFWKEKKRAETVWVHNTPSMCVGFSSGRSRDKPKGVITELEKESLVAVHGCCVTSYE